MTPEELETYNNHHHLERFGKWAGTCCLASLEAIEEARKTPDVKPWTLFDLDLVR
jgi:hypothetical protein